MEKELPESAHGPNVKYREHSIFYNPRMPAAVRDDKLTVHICQVSTASMLPFAAHTRERTQLVHSARFHQGRLCMAGQ
jgi:hypothetical protein